MTSRLFLETELDLIDRSLAAKKKKLALIERSKVLDALSADPTRQEQFHKAASLRERLGFEISGLEDKKGRLTELLNAEKAAALSGIDRAPSNRAELLFLFGALARRMNFDHVTVSKDFTFAATLDDKPVRGDIQRFGETCKDVTVCWRKRDGAAPGRYIELERYLLTVP